MAEGRNRAEWARTSAILAMIANVNRDPRKTRAYMPADFDPYPVADRRANAVELGPDNISLLKNAFRAANRGGRKSKGART